MGTFAGKCGDTMVFRRSQEKGEVSSHISFCQGGKVCPDSLPQTSPQILLINHSDLLSLPFSYVVALGKWVSDIWASSEEGDGYHIGRRLLKKAVMKGTTIEQGSDNVLYTCQGHLHIWESAAWQNTYRVSNKLDLFWVLITCLKLKKRYQEIQT